MAVEGKGVTWLEIRSEVVKEEEEREDEKFLFTASLIYNVGDLCPRKRHRVSELFRVRPSVRASFCFSFRLKESKKG